MIQTEHDCSGYLSGRRSTPESRVSSTRVTARSDSIYIYMILLLAVMASHPQMSSLAGTFKLWCIEISWLTLCTCVVIYEFMHYTSSSAHWTNLTCTHQLITILGSKQWIERWQDDLLHKKLTNCLLAAWRLQGYQTINVVVFDTPMTTSFELSVPPSALPNSNRYSAQVSTMRCLIVYCARW